MADEATESAPAAPAASSGDNPQLTESFVESMRRIAGGDMDDSQPELTDVERAEAAEAAPAAKAPGKPAAKAPEPAAAAGAVSTEAQKAAWIEQAKQYGYALDESGRVTTKERAEWRQAKSAQKQWLASQEAEARAKIDNYVQQHVPYIERAKAIASAVDGGDFEALAKAVGYQDWTKLNEDIIAKNSDPSYREVLALKRSQAERDERDRQAAENYQAQQNQLAQQQRHQKDIEAVTNYAGQSADPLLKELQDVPLVVNSVYQLLVDNHDGASTVTPEQAIDMPFQGGPSIRAQMRGFYEKLHKVFGGDTPIVPAAPAPIVPNKPKRPSGATISTPTAAVEPSEPRRKTESEWVKLGAKRLRDAQLEDERNAKAS